MLRVLEGRAAAEAEIAEARQTATQISEEAYSNPEIIKTAPHNSTIHTIDHSPLDDPARWAVTWRGYLRKHGAAGE